MPEPIRLTSPASPINVKLVNARIERTEGLHDVAQFKVPIASIGASTPYVSGLPIHMTWPSVGSRGAGSFFGYVDKVSPLYRGTGSKVQSFTANVSCVGSTYPMKSSDYSVYTSVTADQAARRIADEFQLACIADPHLVVWPQLAQEGKSWWAWLLDIAKRVGYTVLVDDSILYFIDRRTAGGRMKNPPEKYSVVPQPLGFYDVQQLTIRASSGDGVDSMPGTYFLNGISAFSGASFQLEGTSTDVFYGSKQVYQPQFRRALQEVPSSLVEAQSLLDAAQSNSLFTTTANLIIQCNNRLRPGILIDLVMQDGKSVFSGTWYVLEAVHLIAQHTQQTQLKIGTDATGVAFSIPGRVVPTMNTITIPPITFRNNRWVATWSLAA